MSNGFQDNAGGISFSTPLYSFGNTTPAVNSGFTFDLPLATVQSFQNRALEFSVQNSNANRGFLDNVISNSQNALAKSNERVMNQLGNINQSMAETAQYGFKKRSGRCFITTAVCQAENKPDDCDELQTLRHFRDVFMQETEMRKLLVQTYYAIAPDIVAEIERHPKRDEIYGVFLDAYIIPAVSCIKAGDNRGAFKLYIEMINAAITFALGE